MADILECKVGCGSMSELKLLLVLFALVSNLLKFLLALGFLLVWIARHSMGCSVQSN